MVRFGGPQKVCGYLLPAFGMWDLAFVWQAGASGNWVGMSVWNKADAVNR